jgi:hypothetical protein
MPSLTLLKHINTPDVNVKGHSMVLTITNSEDIEKEVFVKQRLINFAIDQVEDVFAAVCSPSQLEDLPKNNPSQDSSYFRVNSVELRADSAEGLRAIFTTILTELRNLTKDLEALTILDEGRQFTIQPSGVTETA